MRNFCLCIFCLKTRFRNKYLDYCKFAIFFADYWSRALGLSKNLSNVIDMYHNKKIVSKPNVRLNRVKCCVFLRNCKVRGFFINVKNNQWTFQLWWVINLSLEVGVIINLGLIGSAFFTFIGYKQTDRQTRKVYKYKRRL